MKEDNQEYLLGLIDSYDIRNDPDRVYQQAIYKSLRELELKKGHLIITNGKDLLAWHRYMLESEIRNKEVWTIDEVILKVSDIIRKGVSDGWIKKTLVYRDDSIAIDEKGLGKYNHRYLFPYRHANYHNNTIVFIPQCTMRELDFDDSFAEVFINTATQDESLKHLLIL